MRTGFVPLPSLQDKEGQQIYSFAQSRRTWQHHHAALEAGHVTTIAELCRHHVKTQNDAAQHLPEIQIANIPTPLDLEWSVRSLKNSALGLDTIPPEVWKIAPAITTRMLYPLLFKCAALAKVPFAVNGGVNHELYKGKGPTEIMTNSRSILLADSIAKLLRKPQRAILFKQSKHLLLASQLGGVPHGSCDFAIHTARVFQHVCAAKRRTSGIVFVDVKDAF